MAPQYTTGTHADGWDDSGLPASVRDYLATGVEKGKRDDTVFWAAGQFRDAGFSQAEAEEKLLERGLADELAASEILKAVKSAYKRPPREPAIGAMAAAISCTTAAPKSTNKPSSAASPGTPPPMTTPLPSPIPDGFRVFLETVFEESERVAIGQGSRNGDGSLLIDYGDTRLRKMWLKAGPPQNLFGVFARINPMQYRGAKNDQVTSYRHTLVEFDFDKNGQLVPKEIQYAALANSGFPISVILDSGNKSLQGLIRIDAADKAQYDERVAIVYEHFRQYDFFDDDNKAENKYCRLPGCDRQLFDVTGKPAGIARQELLAVKIGPTNWDQWQSAHGAAGTSSGSSGSTAFSEEEQQRLQAEAYEFYRSKNRLLPLPMAEAAYYGIAGQIADIIAAVSEPCRESLLAQFHVGFGSILGRNLYCTQGSDHHLNEFVVLVGETAFGRKGTAWAIIRNLLREIDPDWKKNRILDGVQSGEAIIHEIRDPRQRLSRGGKMVHDPGVADKRLAIVEQEFGRVLVVGGRDGNTLSTTLRKCWDSEDDLHIGSKNDPERATHPHVSLIGHITVDELRKRLDQTDNTNGFSNRIMWLVVSRAKIVACPPPINWQNHPAILQTLHDIKANLTAHRRSFTWQKETLRDWIDYYEAKKDSGAGMLGPIIARSAPHVLRLSMLYAALDASVLIRSEHLKAAIAFVAYCERSAQWIFQERTGDKVADKIIWNLERRPNGMTRGEIQRDLFSNHCHETTLNMALSVLVSSNLIELSHEKGRNNKAVERWKIKD
jgi:hypothetical protein